jgi:hypothetical protein
MKGDRRPCMVSVVGDAGWTLRLSRRTLFRQPCLTWSRPMPGPILGRLDGQWARARTRTQDHTQGPAGSENGATAMVLQGASSAAARPECPHREIEIHERDLELPTKLHRVTRKLLIILLILLVLLVALPLGMGMAMGMCSTSHSATCASALGICAAIVGLLVLMLIGVLGIVQTRTPLARVLLLAPRLERPPRVSFI